jgi:hypothetical protein
MLAFMTTVAMKEGLRCGVHDVHVTLAACATSTTTRCATA